MTVLFQDLQEALWIVYGPIVQWGLTLVLAAAILAAGFIMSLAAIRKYLL